MIVTLLTFASAREAVGSGEIEIELAEGADLDALRARVASDYPEMTALWPRLAVAVDGRLVRDNVPLHDGQEVALLPPVSGGEPPRWALLDGPIVVDELVASVRSPRRGAIVIFLGSVRAQHDGRPVGRLTYDAYRPMALAALETICEEIAGNDDELAVAIHHRLGEVAAGTTSVAIVTASPHRDAAYRASRQALERLKREVPIWKREHYLDGEAVWREEEPLANQEPQLVSTAGHNRPR